MFETVILVLPPQPLGLAEETFIIILLLLAIEGEGHIAFDAITTLIIELTAREVGE